MFYPAKIVALNRMTPEAINVEFQVDFIHQDRFNFKAGQYIVLRIPQLNAAEHRSYSLSSAPWENKLQIGVKKQINGFISTHLCDQAKVGDSVDIMAPAGSFILSGDHIHSRIVAFVAGSGITPVISVIKQQLKLSDSRITLFYGNKNSGSVMYQSELKFLQEEFPGRLEVLNVFSKQSMGSSALEGRIDDSKVNRWKENLFSVHETTDYLLCGPGTMVETIQTALLNLGIGQDRILTEYFTAPSRVTPPEIFKTSSLGDGFHIQVRYEGKQYNLQSANNKSVILDLGLKHGLDLPYSCKSGVCSTCQAKLLSGEVKMENNYVLSDTELKQGFILTCQSHPITPQVVVDYDMR